jgi:hypothetical protein
LGSLNLTLSEENPLSLRNIKWGSIVNQNYCYIILCLLCLSQQILVFCVEHNAEDVIDVLYAFGNISHLAWSAFGIRWIWFAVCVCFFPSF